MVPQRLRKPEAPSGVFLSKSGKIKKAENIRLGDLQIYGKSNLSIEEGEPVVTYATEGERLLEVAQKSNVPIDAPCSGNASCGKCRVRLVSGELDSKITRHNF